MPYFLRYGLLSLIVVATAGCASIVSRSTYPVTIKSDPTNVNIRTTDRNESVIFQGVTPVTIPLKAGSGYFKNAIYEVVLSQDGFKSQIFVIESQIDGWYFGNIAIGGFLGMLVVDPLTGAMWKIPSELYSFTLEPASDEASTKNIRILTLDEVPDHLRDKMELIKEASEN